MATSSEISEWFDRGKSSPENTHMLVVCDTFDYEDYPVFVKKDKTVQEVYSEYNGKNMQRVMEVYNLNMDKNAQLTGKRTFNF